MRMYRNIGATNSSYLSSLASGYTDMNQSPYTKLLLHCDGVEGGQIFKDYKRNTINVLGNTKTVTSNKKFGTASAFFNGTGDRLRVPASVDWFFALEAFTIDFWICLTSALIPNRMNLIGSFHDINNWNFGIELMTDGTISTFANSNFTGGQILNNVTFPLTWTPGVWYHIGWAVQPYGIDGYPRYSQVYRNGVLCPTNSSDFYYRGYTGDAFPNTQGPLTIGSTGRAYTGYMDEIRISKGIAYYRTAGFPVPTKPYPN